MRLFLSLSLEGRREKIQFCFPSLVRRGPRGGRKSSLANSKIIFGVLALIFVTASLIHAQTKSDGSQSLLNQALEFEKGRNYSGAEEVYRKALLLSPDDPEILKRLGLVCQEQGKIDESIEIFQKILKRAPVYPGVNALLGISYYSLNKFDKTIEASQKELTGNPKDKQARYYLALAFSASGRLPEAIQELEILLKDDPQNVAIMYQLAVDYRVAANRTAQNLAKLYPDSEFTHAIRAEYLADNLRFEEAIKEFKEVIRKNPNFPGIHVALGQVYWQHKDLELAQQELKQALVEDPNQPLANYYLGDIFVTNKEFLQAIPHLEITISVYSDLAEAYVLLGKCYAGTGDLQRAVQFFTKALEKNPDLKEVHFQLGEVYARLGNKEESQKQLEIFQRLTQERQKKDSELLEEAVKKLKDSGTEK